MSVSFGADWSWVGRAHDAGIAAATQVYDSMGARRAEDAGIDLVVARGAERGGHGEATRDTAVARCGLRCRIGASAGGRRNCLGPQPGRGAGRRRQRGMGRHPTGGVPGGADRRRQPSGPDRGAGNRHHDHPGLRRRPRPSLAGAVPGAGAGQRLRRALDGQGGRARGRSAGPPGAGRVDRRRRPSNRTGRRGPGVSGWSPTTHRWAR